MANVPSASKIFIDSLGKYSTWAVWVQPGVDSDALACALAWYHLLLSQGKAVEIFHPGEMLSAPIARLPGSSHIKGGFKPFPLVVDLKFDHGSPQKIQYRQLNDSGLRFVLSSDKENLSLGEVSYFYQPSWEFEAIILVGVASLSDLSWGEMQKKSLKQVTVVNFDNQETNEQYADINLVDTAAPSLCESFFYHLLEWGRRPSSEIIQCLLVGLDVSPEKE